MVPFKRISAANEERLRQFTVIAFERFKDNPEGAVSFIGNVIDRQIAKASGLLSFNSLLFAGLQVSSASKGWLTITALLLTLIACLPLLALLFVDWRKPDSYRSPQEDFQFITRLAMMRSRLLAASLGLSIIGTVISMLIVLGNR